MKNFIMTYAIALSLLLIIDGAWLLATARAFYAVQLQHLMATHLLITPALILYALYAFGIVFFVIHPLQYAPLMPHTAVWQAALHGFILGLVCYATFNLSNLATLRDWPLLVVAVDLFWGSCMTAIVSALTMFLASLH